MGTVFVILLAVAVSDQPEARDTDQGWREAERTWRESFQTAHKDYKPRPPDVPHEEAPTPLTPLRPQFQYAILPTPKGFQVLRIAKGRLTSVDRPWDSRQAAEYAIQDLVKRDRFELFDEAAARRQPARHAQHRISRQHLSARR
jgi:hypothetical protein